MATTYLSLAGLQHYDSKIKNVAVGSADITGRTITLYAIDGTAVGTVEIPQTVYELASSTAQGLMSAEMFVKVEGIAEGATKTEESTTNGQLVINGEEVKVYVHPNGQALATAGLYKITTDAHGHITTGAAVTKADLVALGLPAQDTTYGEATQSQAGLMSGADKTKLDGVSEGATKVEVSATNGNIKVDGIETVVYKHEEFTEHASGLYKVAVNAEGHVSAASAVQKSDIVALGIPAQDTTYDLANADKEGLQSAAHFSKVEGIEAGAQVNKLEKVSVNGEALTINSKGVNIDLSGYALKTDLTGLYDLKGSVDNFADLPADAEKGDVYNIVNADAANGILAGDNVVWTGSEWDKLGGTFVISAIQNSEIDALFA